MSMKMIFVFFLLSSHGFNGATPQVFLNESLFVVQLKQSENDKRYVRSRKPDEEKKSEIIGFVLSAISLTLIIFSNSSVAIFGALVFGALGGLICLSALLEGRRKMLVTILGSFFGSIGFFWAIKQIQKTRL